MNIKILYLCLEVVVNYLSYFSEHQHVLHGLEASCLQSLLQAQYSRFTTADIHI